MKQLFIMAHDTARANAVEAVRNAPSGYRVEIKPATRSGEQNSLIHAIVTEWGKAIGWKYGGIAVDLDDLKVIAMSAYRKQQRGGNRFVIGLEGEPVDLQLKTSKLTKAECSEFVDMLQAVIAEVEA